jgi:alpha-amylase
MEKYMKSINLIFGCHAHQPVGNFDFVFERAYQDSYKPFLDVLEAFPAVRTTLHFTGPLFDWFEKHSPAFLDRLAALVNRGQVEIMGGGYYEPLLCAIPQRDARAQIQRMQRYCEKRFGKSPRGMWLTERVWEPHMAKILNESGVEYTALDDAHFLCSGLAPEALFGYYLTEDEGRAVKVFPIMEKLRYLVPFHQVHETIDWLREHATESGERCAVLHDDYEKFGVWPGTNKSVYGEGWLERFFQALTDNKDWLRCVTYSDYLDRVSAQGRTYITCASYDEMMTWALPTAMQRNLVEARKNLSRHHDLNQQCAPFMRGGFWRNFLAKYPESNNIQKRMLRASARLENMRSQFAGEPGLEEAEKLVHQGQCNCAYWHGVFGGLYLNHLRTALYEKIIAADAVMDALDGSVKSVTKVEITDFDGDGNPEAILENDALALFFSPTDGGTLFEIDYKKQAFNFGNVLTRREEVYHDALKQGTASVAHEAGGDVSIHDIVNAKEADLHYYLIYDPWRRVSLRDRFLESSATAETLWSGTEPELGSHASSAYDLQTDLNSITLSKHGQLFNASEDVLISKKITLPPGGASFQISYTLSTETSFPANTLFGMEFCLNLLTGDAHDRYYWSEEQDLRSMRLGARGKIDALSHLALRDEWQGIQINLRFSLPARVFHFPIETVSQSEGGQERVHQGCVVLPGWTLADTETGSFSVQITVDIEALSS